MLLQRLKTTILVTVAYIMARYMGKKCKMVNTFSP